MATIQENLKEIDLHKNVQQKLLNKIEENEEAIKQKNAEIENLNVTLSEERERSEQYRIKIAELEAQNHEN